MKKFFFSLLALASFGFTFATGSISTGSISTGSDIPLIEITCPTFTGSKVFYNTTSYTTIKDIYLQNTTFQKYEDDDYVYFNAEPSNNIDFNGVPVAFTGSFFAISGNYNVFVSGGVLFIQDYVLSGEVQNITGFELLQFTGSTNSVSGSTDELLKSTSQSIIGLFSTNIPKIIALLAVVLVVYILSVMLKPKKKYGI